MFYIGCPMWGYKEWLGNFFPARTPANDFLRLYSQKLTTVEGNTIFYALPSAETVARWSQETPASFRFCPKVLRSISHEGQLSQQKSETLAFIERMRGFGERLGPIFLQLPPSFGPAQIDQLQAWLDFWPEEVRLAVEVRHPDFYQEPHVGTLDELLRSHNVARVIMDTRPIRTGTPKEQKELQARERKPHLPVHITTTTDFAFVRYIGHPRIEVNEPFLDHWAQQLADWYKQGLTVYAFCHCPYEVHSPEICYQLYQRVRALISLPPLAWQPEEPDSGPEQMRLF
ncbi:DUF72 domain-containing protein [Dictyobacter formicarum]|uniref:DUF72 domain-containing protein n=1 Tax=Dictyobacter formicarum TaxID=2778368 RepID=A0ABQ3VG76_9CHLR|nr:DUF72 domain-containing protein [Dictyobacter formicarum]GHO84726.1 hypothetical protein KSZ_27320 [Dictyobacter formicarum]